MAPRPIRPATSAPHPSDPQTDKNQSCVLVVDDDPTFRLVARASLEGAGFRVEEAENGRLGIAKFEESRPDLVVLDIRMPELDGYETCVALRNLPAGRRTPIVMLTGLHDPESVEKAYEAGATDFISKPVNYAILNHRLRQILRANRFMIDFDGLTGLPNRARLLSHVRRALAQARRSRQSVGILFLDLDGFRDLNQAYGPRGGDEILRQVADRLGCLRSTDYLARNCEVGPDHASHQSPPASGSGGDEFIIVLPEVPQVENCAIVARRIREMMARPFRVGGDEIVVTASIGISAYPQDGVEPHDLLTRAETAVDRARRQGSDRYEFYQESLNASTQRRFSIEGQLRGVLEREELEVYYQPRVDIQESRLAGMEALARWPVALGEVPPGEFIPIAEAAGLIAPLGDVVFRTACARFAEMQRNGLPTPRVSINLAAAQFQQEGFASQLAGIAQELHVDPSLVELELTEAVLMNDPDTSVATLEELRRQGFRIALDDFGTGYSSLSHLELFSLDTLKIDQRLVRDIAKDEQAAIAAAIIALGHALGLRVVAEGVEQPGQLELLRTHGCDEVQGYVFTRPLPADAYADWSSRWETAAGAPVMQTVADSLQRPDGR